MRSLSRLNDFLISVLDAGIYFQSADNVMCIGSGRSNFTGHLSKRKLIEINVILFLKIAINRRECKRGNEGFQAKLENLVLLLRIGNDG
jgi:hypothetical protein